MAEVSFGEWLRRRRKAEGWTQEQLALQISCSTSALKKIEAEERRPSAQIVERLAEIFNIPPNELTKFLRFARGDWQAISGSSHEDSPWLVSSVRVTKQVETIALKQNLPSGTVTFLFTDVEGSTKLAQQYPDAMPALLARHHEILNQSIQNHNGYVFQVVGDEFAAAFHSAQDALNAALNAQHLLQNEAWSPATITVRMGIHTGAAQLNDASVPAVYLGYTTLALTQRIMSAGHGGQVLLSNATETLVHGQLPQQVNLRDMGEHKFKDVLQPLRVFQVIAPDLQKEFPALRALEVFPNNLPTQLTSFVGRSKEIEQIKEHLKQSRLVTLTGSGGIGKTRLALQVASELLPDFPEGVWLVELAPLSDPSLLPLVVVNTLGLIDQEERPPLTVLTDFLHDKHILVLLDNCEHLIQACAQLAEALLHACPNLHILATSREALEISGETLYHVPSLIIPDLSNITFEILPQYEAVQLFVERAQSAQRDFSLTQDNAHAIAQVCYHLDGIPLALELAAARVRVLRAEEIAMRLDDRFHLLTGGSRTAMPRHQTLRAMIDWSHDLLSELERVLLRRLSVFAGGWRLGAAEAVCGAEGIESDMILDLLSHLVNKSLVVVEHKGEESRYRLHETIRQYAREKLFETEDVGSLRGRHLDYFIQIAEQGFEELRGPNDLLWLEKLEIEHDNFRAALGWAIESPDVDPQKALQLSGALYAFWIYHGHGEGYSWLAEALKTTPDMPTVYWCRALFGIAQVSYRIGKFNEAGEYSENALTTARQLDIPTLIIESLFVRAFLIMANQAEAEKLIIEGLALARATGNKYLLSGGLLDSITIINRFQKGGEAMQMAQEAYEIARSLGNTSLIASSLFRLAALKGSQGNYKEARSLLQESEILSRKLKDKENIAYSLLQLGIMATKETDYGLARQSEEESLQIFRDLGDTESASFALFNLGWTAYVAGDYDRAASLFKEARNNSTRDRAFFSSRLIALGLALLAQGNEKHASEMFAESLELLKSFEDRYWLAKCLEGMSGLSALSHETAACLLGCAEAVYEEMAFMIPPSERPRHDALVEKARNQLDEEKFNTLWAYGKAMTYEQAIAYALEKSDS